MNKKLSICMILILYAALAGITGVLAYLQENNIIAQSHGVSCGSCPKELKGINELPGIDQMGMP